MVDLYKSYGYDRSMTGIQYDWFTSAPIVNHHLEQFVRLQGCFVPSDDKPDSVAVEFRATSFNSAEMMWRPGYYLSFVGLEIIAVPGQHYTLMPYCHINNPTLTRMAYTTSCDWLEWDENSASFVGIVPMHCCAPKAHFTVNAFSVQEFDERVRLKQAIRSRITITVQVPNISAQSGLLKGLRLENSGSLAYSEASYDSEESHGLRLRENPVWENAPLPPLPPPTEANSQRDSDRILRESVLARQTAPSPSHDKFDQSHKALDVSAATAHAVKSDRADDFRDKEELVRRNTFP